TIYGIWFVVSQGLSATAFVTLLAMNMRDKKPFSDVVTPGLTRDLGNVMLTFTMFWAYISLSQWLIIYSGNLPEETSYYLNRGLGPTSPSTTGFYWFLATLIVFGQFFVPFLALLSGRTKR